MEENNSGLKSQPSANSAGIAGPAAISIGSPSLCTGTPFYLNVRERRILCKMRMSGNNPCYLDNASYADVKASKRQIQHLIELGLIVLVVYRRYALTEKGKKFRFPKKWAYCTAR